MQKHLDDLVRHPDVLRSDAHVFGRGHGDDRDGPLLAQHGLAPLAQGADELGRSAAVVRYENSVWSAVQCREQDRNVRSECDSKGNGTSEKGLIKMVGYTLGSREGRGECKKWSRSSHLWMGFLAPRARKCCSTADHVATLVQGTPSPPESRCSAPFSRDRRRLEPPLRATREKDAVKKVLTATMFFGGLSILCLLCGYI